MALMALNTHSPRDPRVSSHLPAAWVPGGCSPWDLGWPGLPWVDTGSPLRWLLGGFLTCLACAGVLPFLSPSLAAVPCTDFYRLGFSVFMFDVTLAFLELGYSVLTQPVSSSCLSVGTVLLQ